MSIVWLIEVQYIKLKRWQPIIGKNCSSTKREASSFISIWQRENPGATYRAVQYRRVKFCGGSASVKPDEIGSGGQHVLPYHAGCQHCRVYFTEDEYADAISEWNKRAAAPSSAASTIADHCPECGLSGRHKPMCSQYGEALANKVIASMQITSTLPLTREELLKQQTWARQDDWDKFFVGSDIRVLIGQALAALDLEAKCAKANNNFAKAVENMSYWQKRAEQAEAEVARLTTTLESAAQDAQASWNQARKYEAEVARLIAELEAARKAMSDFRDTVLHERGSIAENGMTNDQINNVLSEFDAAIDAVQARK